MSILSDKLPGEGSLIKECAVCSSKFKVKPSSEQRRKTCSRECATAYRSQKITKECGYCGKEMKVSPSRESHGRGLVCSRECQYAKNSENSKSEEIEIFSCLCCNENFTLLKSKTKNKKGAGKYCSRLCRDRHRKGHDHPMYINGVGSEKRGNNWQSQKRKAKKRDGFVCQHCRLSDNQSIEAIGQPLHVHHITPYRFFDDYKVANKLSNLVTLCAMCHRIADAKIVRSGL